MKTFLISDTHFGHRNIIRYEAEHRQFSTIEEHDEYLVEQWNQVVGRNDLVIHLGDVLMGERNFLVLGRLNGRKRLILGNHDVYSTHKYLEYFEKVSSYDIKNNCILSHIPVHPQQLYRFRANIHGHLHHHVVGDPMYINVACEHTNLRPILLDEVCKRVPAPL